MYGQCFAILQSWTERHDKIIPHVKSIYILPASCPESQAGRKSNFQVDWEERKQFWWLWQEPANISTVGGGALTWMEEFTEDWTTSIHQVKESERRRPVYYGWVHSAHWFPHPSGTGLQNLIILPATDDNLTTISTLINHMVVDSFERTFREFDSFEKIFWEFDSFEKIFWEFIQ